MNTKLPLLFVCIMTTMCVFAQREMKRPFDRENLRERRTQSEIFSFRENAKPEMRKARTLISTLQSNAIKHRLDSIVFRVWNEGVKFEFRYDNHGRLTAWIGYYWAHNAWREEWKEEYIYDSNGNIATWISYYWAHNAWREGWKEEYTYDSNGNLVMRISHSRWNNAWEGEWKMEFTYDNNGNRTMEIWYRWMFAEWEEDSKYEFTYDNNGNLITEVVSHWGWTSEIWEESWKIEYTYDSSGNMILAIEYDWNWTNQVWRARQKTEYIYDSNGNLIRQTNYSWWNSEWEEHSKTEFIYDTNGNLTAEIEYRWDWADNVWREDWKMVFEFDLSVSASDVFFPHILDAEVNFSNNSNKMTGVRVYEWWNNAWQGFDETLTFHYSQTPTNIPNISESSFTVFPNPVLDNFQISGITENMLVSITDLNGRIVLQQTVAPNEQISVGHLSAGMYFVRVNGETVKIVKR